MSDSVSVALKNNTGSVEGRCSAQFQPVLDAFLTNFSEHDEVGASVCVTYQGETVVDLWGGTTSNGSNTRWTQDTVSLVFSATKGVVALVANVLIDRGLLDPCQPVAEIWPEFSANGKEAATVRMMLDHSVGVPALRTPVKPGGLYDWDYMCELIATHEPFWEPGTRVGYHALTFGWNVGELIRRVTGKSVGTNIQEILAEPLGLGVWVGLPESVEPNVAPMIPSPMNEAFGAIFEQSAIAEQSISALALHNDGGWLNGLNVDAKTGKLPADSREGHAAEIPAAGGITNAAGLAGAYRPFAIGGTFGGKHFVSPRTLIGMEEISSATNRDATNMRRVAWSLGLLKGRDNRVRSTDPPAGLMIGRRAFGHTGAGGSCGFADPEPGLSFGYTMNRMDETGDFNVRGQSLVNATYRVLGYADCASGHWTK